MTIKTSQQTTRTNVFIRAWRILTEAHPDITEVGERRQAQLLAVLSLILVVPFTFAILSNPQTLTTFIVFLAITVFAYIISRTKFYRIGGYFFSFGFTSIAYFNIYNGSANSVDSSLSSIIPISLILASAILSQKGFLFLAIATIAATAGVRSYGDPKYFADPTFSFGRTIGITFSTTIILFGITVFRESVERARLKEVQEFNRELEDLSANLEKRVADRTKALETSSEVSRRLASILDPRELAGAVVNEVRDAYNYYYAQIYLFDNTGENLVLTAGTGVAGAEMLKRGHSLPKGSGLVGRSAENNESILVADTSQNADWLPNELLPHTRAEAAIPITIGNRVLGVLDVQDDVTNDINSGDITLLESLASQVAISLRNAESYARAEAALQEAKSLVENAPEAIIVVDLTTGLFTDPNENAVKLYGLERDDLVKVGPAQMSPPTQPDGRDSTGKAMEKISEAMQGKNPVFDWMHRNAHGQDIPCEVRLVRLPGDKPRVRASVTDITERNRLQELTALRARQQESINLITQRIQAATTIEDALQVAARELGHALGKRQTWVALEPSALGGNGNEN
jgi:PAS domain S-box-containing protein